MQLGGCGFESQPGILRSKVYSAFHPSRGGKWVPAAAGKAKAGMAHSDCGWTCGCAGKAEIPWEHVPYLNASAVVFHYEEELYQVYAALPFTFTSAFATSSMAVGLVVSCCLVVSSTAAIRNRCASASRITASLIRNVTENVGFWFGAPQGGRRRGNTHHHRPN